MAQSVAARVVHANQLAVGKISRDARVVIAEAADAHHTQAKCQTVTPRSLASMNERKWLTSGVPSSSDCASLSACPMFMDDDKTLRYARFKAMRVSSVKPRRCKPTLFSPYNLSGLPAALTKGGTSFITAADPPTKACRPMRTN